MTRSIIAHAECEFRSMVGRPANDTLDAGAIAAAVMGREKGNGMIEHDDKLHLYIARRLSCCRLAARA